MIDIWIRYFNRNGVQINTWEKIESIPSVNYAPIQLVSPKVKTEMNKSESMDFTVEPNSAYWDAFIPYKTYLWVTLEGFNIFYGRVLTVSTTMWGTKTIQCEGPLSFLTDSYYPPTKESSRATISARDYLYNLLDNHNYYVDAYNSKDTTKTDPRGIYLGEVPGQYSASVDEAQKVETESQKFGVTGWTETKSAVEELRSYYGGYMRTRMVQWDQDGEWYAYLDWFNDYFNGSGTPAKIELTKNLLDFTANTEYSNIFTAIIPTGKNDTQLNGYSVNGKTYSYWISASDVYDYYGAENLTRGYHTAEEYRTAISKYGWIYKSVSFPNATTKQALFEQAVKWFKHNFQPSVENYSIKALDMRIVEGASTRPLLTGDLVQFSYNYSGMQQQSKTYTVISCEYDLYNPENNQYKIGIPANMLTKMYSINSSGKSSSGGAGGYMPPEEGDDKKEYSYENWLTGIKRYLQSHNVPGTISRYLISHAYNYQIYNAITGVWDTIDEFTYAEVQSRGLIGYIAQTASETDRELWKSVVYSDGSEETEAWIDYIKSRLANRTAPDGYPLYDETNGTMYNANINQRVSITAFSVSLAETFGLLDHVKETYNEDLREAVVSTDSISADLSTGGKTTNIIQSVRNAVTGKIETVKAGWLEILNGAAKLFRNKDDGTVEEVDLGAGSTTVNNLTTEIRKTETQVGMVISSNDEDGYYVDAAKLMLSIVKDEQTGKKSTLAEVMADDIKITGKNIDIKASEYASLGIVTTGLGGDSDISAGLIVRTINEDESEQRTLAELLADKIEIKGKQISLTASEAASLGIVTVSKGPESDISAGLVFTALNDGTLTTANKRTLAELFADYINIKGSQISITATEAANLGILTTDNAGNTITAKFITDAINGGTATIDAKNLNLTNTEVINLINGTGEVTINANKVNLTGYLQTKNLASEIARIDSLSTQHLSASGSISSTSFVRATDFQYGDGNSILDAYDSASVEQTGSTVTITLGRASSRLQDTVLVFNKAATINGTWDRGVFTVSATSGFTNTVITSLTNTGHWGSTSTEGEDVNKYYYATQATIGSTLYDTGNVTEIDATPRYNAGWGNSYNAIGISHADATLANGGSITIYPTGKQTPTSNLQYITGKSCTISSLTYSLDPSTSPAALNPGGSVTIKLMSQNGNDTPVEQSRITVSARAIQAGDITADDFEQISATGGYTSVGTATPSTSTTYWGFRISDIKNFYVAVSGYTDRYNAGWSDSYAEIGLSEVSQTLSHGNSVTIYPTGKATPSTSSQNITRKGITITAASIVETDIIAGAFTQISSTSDYHILGTATPDTSDTYWGFTISGVKSYYVKVNSYTDRYNLGWSESYAEIGLSETSKTLDYGEELTIYPTGKATPSTSSQNITRKGITITAPSATSSYNEGWSDSYAEIGISEVSKTLDYGEALTIYPTGKATPSTSSQNITRKGITITAPASTGLYDSGWADCYDTIELDTGTTPIFINPGEYQEVWAKAKRLSSDSVTSFVSGVRITANKATIAGSWNSSGTFTASPTVSGASNTLTTTVTLINRRWGNPDTNPNDELYHYYGGVGATIGTGSTIYNTGVTFEIDSSWIYTGGWQNCYVNVGISHADATLGNGGSIIIYPTGKQTPTSATQNITGKSCTISSLKYSLDPSTTPAALAPGGSTVVKLMTQNGSDTPVEASRVTINARAIDATDISCGAFTQIYSTSGYNNLGTATPSTSDTYWGFTISGVKSYYVKVNAYTIGATWADYYNSGYWGQATSQTSWYAQRPALNGSGYENWNCGARTAYTTGARTCYIGDDNNNAVGSTVNLDFGGSKRLWAEAKDVDGNVVWNTNSVTVTAPSPSWSCSNTVHNGTSYTTGALSCGGVALTSIAKNTYLLFTVSVGTGQTKQCYISIN